MRTDGLGHEESAAIAGRAARGEDVGDVSAVNLVPDDLRGLDRYEARARVVEAITADGLAVTAAEGAPVVDAKPIMQPFGDRSGQSTQPFLTDQRLVQLNGLPKRRLALAAYGEGTSSPPTAFNPYTTCTDN